MEFLRKKMLTDYITGLKNGGYDPDTIDFIINQIDAGFFDDSLPEDIQNRAGIFDAIIEERARQDNMHEFPLELRMAVLAEELGEVASALQAERVDYLISELIQVAAVAVRWIEALEGKK